jgi:translation elongation factor EF-G
LKQKKLILVKLIGIGNNKDDNKNEKMIKIIIMMMKRVKVIMNMRVMMIANIRIIKVVIMRMKIVYINVLTRLVSINPGH